MIEHYSVDDKVNDEISNDEIITTMKALWCMEKIKFRKL